MQTRYPVGSYLCRLTYETQRLLPGPSRQIETDIGPIDTAILAAGVYRTVTGDDPDPGVIRSVAEVNLFGTIECLHAVLQPMKLRRRVELQ